MTVRDQTRTSRTLAGIATSPLFGMLAKAGRLKAAGRPVISLTAGEPDFDTPAHIVAAAKAAMDAGQTRYTPVAGTPSLKAAIATKLQRDNGLTYAPQEIIATTGAKQALFNFCLATLDPGDEVIFAAPYWPSYVDMVRLAGGRAVIVPTSGRKPLAGSSVVMRHWRAAPLRWILSWVSPRSSSVSPDAMRSCA